MISLELIIFILGILLGAIFFGGWGEKLRPTFIKDTEIMYPLVFGILVVLLIFGIGAQLFGSDTPILNGNMLGYGTNLWTEVASIGITVFILDRINRHRDQQASDAKEAALKAESEAKEKELLILQLRSIDHATAKHAFEQLHTKGWLEEILKNSILYDVNLPEVNLLGADLEGAALGFGFLDALIAGIFGYELPNTGFANLQQAYLIEANLKSASLGRVNLKNANLMDANLQEAFLYEGNLGGANLQGANLQGANLHHANLAGVHFGDTLFDEATVLPDSELDIITSHLQGKAIFDKYWTPETDMSRYTDPNHPDFWQPDWAIEQVNNG